jgi:hypothetical protein
VSDIDQFLASIPEAPQETTVPVTPEVPQTEVVQDEPVDPNASPLETLDMDEQIFADGPTRTTVEEWKKQFPTSQVMATLLADGRGLVWRTLNRLEWKNIQNLTRNVQDADKREDIIFSKVVLFPDCKDQNTILNLPAGAVTTVMNEFYLYSGFQPVTESLRL